MPSSETITPDQTIAQLEAKIAQLEAKIEQLERSEAIYRHVVDNAPASISRLTPSGGLIFANRFALDLLGYSLEDLQGKDILPLMYPGELREPVDEYFRIAAAGGDVSDYELTIQAKSGERRILSWNSYHRFDEHGALLEVISFGVDVTQRKRDEAERRELQERVIAAQAETLAELSTPLMPISDDIIAMPLIGIIDYERSQKIIETLLAGVSGLRARTAIIDITGVSVVNTQVANAIISAARAVRLLGAQVILTGIQPIVAQTLVDLGADFEHIITRSTLQSGVDFALGRRRTDQRSG